MKKDVLKIIDEEIAKAPILINLKELRARIEKEIKE
jgi:hypothetical protein